ncbi:hypothetical protein O987_09075 [Comamonas testosteroni TK102]|uniref:Uncharacterized protein n=1 Tax=Comamonas testosteroni TK102 TaxID=1392005 RepID=A0A076PGS0_COMTE|nr:hypothetical protein O987_09075 [Comamonas testosteroni TK102]
MLHHWVVVSLLRTMGTTVTATEAATTAIVGDAMSMSRAAGITTGTSDPIARTDARMTAGARSTDPEVCAAA